MTPDELVASLGGRLEEVEVPLGLAWWETNTAPSPTAERRRAELELAHRALLADPSTYAAVREALDDAGEPLVHRQLELLASAMAPNQVDEATRQRLVELETGIESTYVHHRGVIDGRRVSDNDIDAILGASTDVSLRRQAWEASKSVGAAAAGPLLELVRLRNEAARSLGHPDHYRLALTVGELDEARLFATLDEVDAATAGPFAAWKENLDATLADRYDCAPSDLRPWHYDDPFFQEPPGAGRIVLDEHFAGADLTDLTLRTYDGIGLDIRPALRRSDLEPREGKNQHAFCIDVDRAGDVRVLCNNAPNERWMGTMLHEFGHAVYDLGSDPELPFLLRTPPHMLTTEAVAMLFGRLGRDPGWLAEVGGLGAAASRLAGEIDAAQRAGMLVFARWALVMTHFERGLYADPDADHATRWWDLVERFQLVRRPDDRVAPDWASKIHLAVAPVYYQNYLYGELLASQLAAALDRDAGGLAGRPEAGRWLSERVFAPAASMRWDHLVRHATGEELTPAHFVAQYAA